MPRTAKKPYFGPDQEEAVRIFLTATTYTEKNKVYNEFLRAPLNKMVESIIRKYKLYRDDMSFITMHDDTLSFLITKCDKFKPEKGKKAYSYFGTIVKNYLLGQLIKDNKKVRTQVSYEDYASDLEERPDMLVYQKEDHLEKEGKLQKLMAEIIGEISEELNNEKLTDNERSVGESLVYMFENWEIIFSDASGNNKFNKNLVLHNIREMTSLTTKEIRNAMRRYKKIYKTIKEKFSERYL
jgi:hypothetical protein|tara:strand:- start:4826 stop:5545 length:720 start_codon:yes stop_codon:yes gene_type:complete